MYVVYNRGTCTAKVFVNNRPATEAVLKLNHREDASIIRTIRSWVSGRVSKGELPVQNYTVHLVDRPLSRRGPPVSCIHAFVRVQA